MKIRRFGTVVLFASAGCLSVAGRAYAWDSVLEKRLVNFPAEDVTFGQFTANPRQFVFHNLKDAIGAPIPVSPDTGVTKIFQCTPDFIPTDGNPGGNLANCALASANIWQEVDAGWIRSRQPGEVPHESEHTIIARRAAQLAGLSPATTLFDPIWVRYAAQNAFVTSAKAPGAEPPYTFVAGQSLRPVLPLPDTFSFVSREFSLLDFAQLPDFSHSLSDWAQGNETCPIAGITGAYTGPEMEACHAFAQVMGAVNMTHFAPLNHEMWRYYHELAKSKMDECQPLQSLSPKFYTSWEDNFFQDKVVSNNATEAHECEVMAMTYELFGLHFLEDAWSVGHMWYRWGYPSFTDFPTDVLLVPEVEPGPFPPEDEGPRRALIAAVVGAGAGMIHGTKGLLASLLHGALQEIPLIGAVAATSSTQIINTLQTLDDPLNGGHYGSHDVEFIDSLQNKQPGLGDLFWDPASGPNYLYLDPKYQTQRDMMLSCVASSLREVYLRGPQAHGPAAAPLIPFPIDNVDSGVCWDQTATNASMLGAVGAVDLAFAKDISSASLATILGLTNTIILAGITPSIGFVTEKTSDIPEDDPDTLALAQDRDRIRHRVEKKLQRDTLALREIYAKNAEEAPLGTESARAHVVGTPDRILFLDVPSLDPSESVPAQPRGVDYVDHAPPQDIVSASDADAALSRVFWRGDLQRTCKMALADGAAQLNQARAECLRDAPRGGDPESCTACVSLAELLIPLCNATDFFGPIGDSKCSVAGVASRDGLPSWWFDNEARRFSSDASVATPGRLEPPFEDSYNLCEPSIYLALDWCANTPPDYFLQNWSTPEREIAGAFTETSRVTCPGDTEQVFGSRALRRARLLFEGGVTPTHPWLFPMATVHDEQAILSPSSDPCGLSIITDSEEAVWGALAAPANLSDYPTDDPLIFAFAPRPHCGITQRLSRWNRGCAEAASELAAPGPLNLFNAVTGEFRTEATTSDGGTECYLREARKLTSACPAGLECTAGGECVAPLDSPTGVLALTE